MPNKYLKNVNALSVASITLQLIEDIAIYKAQIFSSNGNIFGTRDTSSEIHLTVWKGLEDITSKFSDIEWKRFSVSEDLYEEDLAWGAQHKDKKTFVLLKEDINKQAKIQAEVYANINGERQCVAVEYISFIDVNDLQGSKLPPTNPSDGALWLDTSVIPSKLMIWDEKLGTWAEVTVSGQNRRNLIRNSNFYKESLDYWTTINNDSFEFESLSAKKWIRIKTDTAINDYIGIKQTISNIVKKSNYSFQVLAAGYGLAHSKLSYTIYSIDNRSEKTILTSQSYDLVNDSPKVYDSSFVTLDDTEKIEIIISGEKNEVFDIIATNIKLENHIIITEWEIALEDIQDALDNKVGNSHEDVFNSLTDNGSMQGVYVDIDEHGQKNFYFNASYINTGKLKGELIEAKNLLVTDNNNNTTLHVDDAGNISLKPKSLQIISSSSSSEDEEVWEDVAGVNDVAWNVHTLSSNGTVFKNGVIDTVLYAVVYKGRKDVTEELLDSQFVWIRTSDNLESDTLWNNTNGIGVKTIKITEDDVFEKATFKCQIYDTI